MSKDPGYGNNYVANNFRQPSAYFLPGPPRYEDAGGHLGVVKGETPIIYRRKKPTYIRKFRGCLRGLAITNLVMASFILLLGAACVGTGVSFVHLCWYKNPAINGQTLVTACPRQLINCEAGTALWQGIFAIITSSIGVAALTQPRNRCLLVTYQLVLVTACLLMWGVVVSSATYTGLFAYWVDLYNYGALKGLVAKQFLDLANSNLAISVLLLVFSVNYTFLSIISAALLCYNWKNCCPDERRRSKRDRAPSAIYAAPAMFQSVPETRMEQAPPTYTSPLASPSDRKAIRYYY